MKTVGEIEDAELMCAKVLQKRKLLIYCKRQETIYY